MGQASPPSAPNAGQSYNQGIVAYLNHLPTMLQGEQAARTTYDSQRIQEQLGLQGQFGQQQYQQQLDALNQLDPQSTRIRNQLGNQVSSDLASGYNLPRGMDQEITSQIRGAEAARGNDMGNAAISSEAIIKGQLANQLYQQRLTNAGNFLAGPTPEQQLLAIQPVTPDRSSQYVNPSAGYQGQQFAMGNYQNMLAQYQLSGGGRSPWAGAAGGAASGAAAGSSFGPYGAAAGGIIGGVSGYFSDERSKADIKYFGKTKAGIPLHTFRYIGSAKRFLGVIAQEVRKLVPEAVKEINGRLAVDYSMIQAPFHEVAA